MDLRRLRIADQYAALLSQTPHAKKRAVVERGADEMGVSLAQFYRELQKVQVRDRKRRADAGQFDLTAAEADEISGYLMEGYRQNNKKGRTLQTSVDVLRTNGVIRAERVDPTTGEIKPLSYSAIDRALKGYGVHPDQLRRATPHQSLKSLHPNHVWQVDGSVCVIYYLPGGGAVIEELDPAVHYKNKPHNLKAIEEKRVIRYVLTDHTTNVVRWRYYPHAESGEHTVRFLAWAMAPKADEKRDPFHGRPRILMVDPGATSGGVVKRFCARLGIELIVNKPRNPRAKGSVEGAQNRVEIAFEHGLRDMKRVIRDFNDLNTVAELFQLWWNSTKTMQRHGMTRFDAWMHIQPHQLTRTQPEATLLSLATDEPQKRRVAGDLTVQFKSRHWSVKNVPGVSVSGEVFVHWHPFEDRAMAVLEDPDGGELHYELDDVTGHVNPAEGAWGFKAHAAEIGAQFKSPGDTAIDENRKRVAALAAARHEGAIDPYKEARDTEPTTYLPKRGHELDIGAPRVELLPLSIPQAARQLKDAMGDDWSGEHYTWLMQRYPNGVPQEAMAALIEQFRAPAHAPAHPMLKAVK